MIICSFWAMKQNCLHKMDKSIKNVQFPPDYARSKKDHHCYFIYKAFRKVGEWSGKDSVIFCCFGIGNPFFCSFLCVPVEVQIYKHLAQQRRMVKLSFKVKINSALSQVWEYYSNFENIVEWDPNTTHCEEIKATANKIGSQYLLKSIFNQNESTLIYTVCAIEVAPSQCRIELIGLNKNVECIDEITLIAQGNETILEYRADICLRGIKVLLTPFILGSLSRLAEDCKEGVLKRSIQKWGTAY